MLLIHEDFLKTKGGNLKKPDHGLICSWIIEVWNDIKKIDVAYSGCCLYTIKYGMHFFFYSNLRNKKLFSKKHQLLNKNYV